MDLGTIKMHIDNFVDTWQGWGKIFTGLNDWYGSSLFAGNVLNVLSGFFTNADTLSSNLSS